MSICRPRLISYRTKAMNKVHNFLFSQAVTRMLMMAKETHVYTINVFHKI